MDAESLALAVLATLIAALIIMAFRQAHARERTPIEVGDATRPAVEVDNRPDDSLPPSFTFETQPTSSAPNGWSDTVGYISWALENGGVHTNVLYRRFTVRGVEDGSVRLDSVAVKVLEQRPPVEGFLLDTAAGGPSLDYYVWADLDNVDAAGYARTERNYDRLDPVSGDIETEEWDLLDVSRTDPATFIVAASTYKYDCDFEIEIHYRGKYRSGRIVLNHQDRPFRVTAPSEHSTIIDIPEEWS